MTNTNAVNRQILSLSAPALGALAADPLVSLVDTGFVSRLGEVELAALGVNAAIFSVAFALFNFLAYGTTPLVANATGRRDTAAGDRTITIALVIAATLGVLAVVVLLIGGRWFLHAVQVPSEAAAPALTYLRIRAWAAPAVLLMLVGHGTFRGFQDTKTPLIVTIWLNVINLALDPLFIFVLGFDLAGAAIATVIAQWFGALWFLKLLRPHWAGYRSIRRQEVVVFLQIGRQLTVRTLSILGALTLATAMAARAGTRVVAAHQVVSQIWFLSTLILDSLAIAGQALVGRFLGEDDPQQVDLVVRKLITWGFLAGLAMAGVMVGVRPWLGTWFGTGQEVTASIASGMVLVAALQPLGAVLFVGDGVYLGAGRFGLLTWSTFVAGTVTVLAFLVGQPTTLTGVWAGIGVLLGVRFTAQAADYLRRGSVLVA